jgi:hypothetical protein
MAGTPLCGSFVSMLVLQLNLSMLSCHMIEKKASGAEGQKGCVYGKGWWPTLRS